MGIKDGKGKGMATEDGKGKENGKGKPMAEGMGMGMGKGMGKGKVLLNRPYLQWHRLQLQKLMYEADADTVG